MNDDLEKFEFYLQSCFYIENDILKSTFSRWPSGQALIREQEIYSICELEKLHNHVHLNAVTTNVVKQRSLAAKLCSDWRKLLDTKYPDKSITIEIWDNTFEVIIYVYQHRIK